MSELLALRATMSLSRGAATAWDTGRILLQHLAQNTRDVVAAVDSRGYLARRLREEVPQEQLFLHPVEVDSAATSFASDRTRDQKGVRQFWPAAPTVSERRLRRLDDLYLESHKVGLLIVDGTTDPAAVLTGATSLVRQHASMVLLDLNPIAVNERTAMAAACLDILYDYGWYDSLLLPVADLNVIGMLITSAAETVFALLPRASTSPWWHTRDLTSGPVFDCLETVHQAAAWRGWTLPVQPEGIPRVTLQPDDSFSSVGFYGPETDGSTIWRWSGPNKHARFWIPVPGYGTWRPALNVFAWGRLAGPGSVYIATQGRQLVRGVERHGRLTLEPVHIFPNTCSRLIEVDLVCADLRPPTNDDPRTLGLCLSGLSLERVG